MVSEILQSVPEITGTSIVIPLNDWRYVMSLGSPQTFLSDEILISARKECRNVLLIRQGQVLIEAQATTDPNPVLCQVGPGLFFGALTMMAQQLSPLHVVAASKVEVHLWSWKQFRELMVQLPLLSLICLEQMSIWQMLLIQRFILLHHGQSQASVAWALLFQSHLSTKNFVEITQEQIGDMVGLTHFTVSRIMAQMKKDRLIDSGFGWFRILQPNKLRQMLPFAQKVQII